MLLIISGERRYNERGLAEAGLLFFVFNNSEHYAHLFRMNACELFFYDLKSLMSFISVCLMVI